MSEQRYRRISRTLHDRCLAAVLQHKADLTGQEIETLNAVARGWAVDGEFVTKADHDAALTILDRVDGMTIDRV